MARLISDDPEVPSFIDWRWHGSQAVGEETWRGYALTLRTGAYEVSLTPRPDDVGVCALGPRDLDDLWHGLEKCREGGEWRFEPAEPNFTLDLRPEPFGLSVHLWLDAGNQTSDHHTWDGIGVRFFTTVAALEEFHRELQAELRETVQAST